MTELVPADAKATFPQSKAAGTPDISWSRKLAKFKSANDGKALFEISVTLLLFAAGWAGAYLLRATPAFPLLVILAGFFAVRLFVIQHDCGHGSFFSSDTANKWLGRCLGPLTMTPYSHWRHQHALHHASCGNLDKRGFGDVETVTVEEYDALSPGRRISYRLYRNPWVMFGLGPSYLFLLRNRLPVGSMRKGSQPWLSVMGTNAAIIGIFAIAAYLLGVVPVMMVHLPIVIVGGTIGVWLFYVQHQFDPTHWDRADEWNRETAALNGSSYYDLPAPLMWVTGYIGIHHAHHLSSGIPFYRLPEVIAEFPELKTVNRLDFRTSLKCVPLALWDEMNRRLISFGEYARRPSAT